MQFKRRYSNYRLSDRKQDFGHLLTKMITHSNQANLRQSNNVMPNDDKLFKLINSDNTLTDQCIYHLVKYVERQIIIIGLILPKHVLSNCYQLITGKNHNQFSTSSIYSTIMNKNMARNVVTLFLILEEDVHMGQRKSNQHQKIIFDLSFILITTDLYAKKRAAQWLNQQSYFEITPSLLIIKEKEESIGSECYSTLQDIFWNIQTISIHDLQRKNNIQVIKEFKRQQRQAYLLLTQQNDQILQFAMKINQMAKIALKKNWRASKGFLCFPTIYFINYLIKGQCKDKRQIIQNTLSNYCKTLQEYFIKSLDNYNLPLDELNLRKSITQDKRNMLLNARKNLTMFQQLFFEEELIEKYIENLSTFFNDKQKDLYYKNNNIGCKLNQDLLEKLYEEIINKHFSMDHNTQERNIDDYQHDFQILLNQYESESIRISSQLKTFNQFMKNKKDQYASNINKGLRNTKKKYVNEKQELQDRLEIQTGILQTLESQLKELEQKRRKIQLQNALLKEDIFDTHKKKNYHQSEIRSTQRSALEITQEQMRKKDYRPSAKTKNIKEKEIPKKCCICCQIM